jgi:hypothetical protein
MITRPTVLVLGAGASQPYGYPSGRDLLKMIANASTNPGSNLIKELSLLEQFRSVPEMHFKQFGDALKASGSQSIDAFLESRNDFIEMGRYAIVLELLRFENPYIFYEKGDWYYYLYDKMHDSNQFESFGASKISIVTFNYDRSLEFFLFRALKNDSQKSPAECVQNFEKIRIIHVHGRFGPSPTEEGIYPYGSAIKRNDLPRFAHQIKIIHEAKDDMVEFKDAQNLLIQAWRP